MTHKLIKMKQTGLIFLMAVFTSLMVVQGCKKYEDGPLISLKSKTKRLLGNWASKKVFIDNIEWEGGANGSIYYNFKDDRKYHRVFEFGKWEFNKDQEKLLMTPDWGGSYELTILRLTSKELWLTNIVSDKVYEYHFEKDDK